MCFSGSSCKNLAYIRLMPLFLSVKRRMIIKRKSVQLCMVRYRNVNNIIDFFQFAQHKIRTMNLASVKSFYLIYINISIP